MKIDLLEMIDPARVALRYVNTIMLQTLTAPHTVGRFQLDGSAYL